MADCCPGKTSVTGQVAELGCEFLLRLPLSLMGKGGSHDSFPADANRCPVLCLRVRFSGGLLVPLA